MIGSALLSIVVGFSEHHLLIESTLLTPLSAGAPQNHWFGPAGDPRAAGIGTPEAIRLVWSSHREIIHDWGPVPHDINLQQS
jgi:hypothetical protein